MKTPTDPNPKTDANTESAEESGYPEGSVDLLGDVREPNYEGIVDWMTAERESRARSVSFDFWCRGNYTRRMLFQRRKGRHPLHVRVSSLEEMRRVHNRLALLGQPVEFVYCGEDCWSGRVLQLHPWDLPHDGGWGYMAALGSYTTIRGRKWFAIVGEGNYLPPHVADWLATDARDEFIAGNLIVSPAENLGLSRCQMDPGDIMISAVAQATPVVDPVYATTEPILALDLPFLDGLSPRKLKKFLASNEDKLFAFRREFRRLVTDGLASGASSERLIDALRDEVGKLQTLSRKAKIENRGSKVGWAALALGGMGLAAAQAPAHVWAATLTLAGVALANLYKQALQAQHDASEHPLYILSQLGLRKPRDVRVAHHVEQVGIPQVELPPAHHWLCPPTTGLRYLLRRKDP